MKTKMMYAAMVAVLTLTSFASCSNSSQNTNKTSDPTEMRSDNMDSKDYQGTYKGTLPCADCSGIETELKISDDMKYTLKQTYQGKGDGKENSFSEEGTYTWDASKRIITLKGDDSERYEYADGMLYALDMDGKRVTGELANMYVLKK